MFRITSRLPLAIAAVAAAVLGVTGMAATANAATASATPLQVSLSADGNGTAAFSSAGNPVLTIGSTGTYAQMVVSNAPAAEPASAPSFTTDNYAAGSPRWVIELSNSYYLFGYPAQLYSPPDDMTTGANWGVNGPSVTACGGSYVTYARALSCADPAGIATVTSAFVVEDGDQAAGTADTLTGVQYDGMTLSPGTVTVTAPGTQSSTEGAAVSVQVQASVNTSDKALTYSASNLPTGLSIDASTGLITGTAPSSPGSFSYTVTATDAYGDTATTAPATWTVTAPPPPSQYVALTKLPPLVLDDPSGSTANGTAAQVWSSKTGVKGNEQFTVVSHGAYDTIALTKDTGLCLDVRNAGTTNGTKVQFWACNGGKDQEWKPTVDGYLEAVYATIADNVTMVLDDPLKGGSGTKLQIWDDNGGAQQFWTVPSAS